MRGQLKQQSQKGFLSALLILVALLALSGFIVNEMAAVAALKKDLAGKNFRGQVSAYLSGLNFYQQTECANRSDKENISNLELMNNGLVLSIWQEDYNSHTEFTISSRQESEVTMSFPSDEEKKSFQGKYMRSVAWPETIGVDTTGELVIKFAWVSGFALLSSQDLMGGYVDVQGEVYGNEIGCE